MAVDCTELTDSCDRIACLYPELACDNICNLMAADGVTATLKKEFNASTFDGDDTISITTTAPIPKMSTYSFSNANCGVFAYGIYLERENDNGITSDDNGNCIENTNSDGTYSYTLSRLVKNLKPYGDLCAYDDGEGDQSIHTIFETLTIGDPSLHIWSRLSCICNQSLASEVRQYYSSQADLFSEGNEPRHAGEMAVVPNGYSSIIIYGAIPSDSSSTGFDWATNYLSIENASTTDAGSVLLWKPLVNTNQPVVYNRGEYAPLDNLVDNLATNTSGQVYFKEGIKAIDAVLSENSTTYNFSPATAYKFDHQTLVISKQSNAIITTNIIGRNVLNTGYASDYDAEVSYTIYITGLTGEKAGQEVGKYQVLAWPSNTNQNFIGKISLTLPEGSYRFTTEINMETKKFTSSSVSKIWHEIIGS